MAATTDNPKVPALRFSEFSNSWKKTKISHIATLVTSGSRDWSKYYSDEGDKFVRMTNLPRGSINLLLGDMKYVKLPSENTDGLRTSLQHGDILISITAELGKIGWIPPEFGTAYINQHTALVRLKQGQCSKFIAYHLSSQKMNKKINRLNDSGAKSGLNLPTIRSVEFFSTSAEEQQKIADFLTAVDTKIQQLKRKHDLMQQYKKGVMQQLFSQQVRFKDDDGRDYPDWEEKRLGEVATFYNGRAYKQNELLDQGKYRVLRVGNFFTNDHWYYSDLDLDGNKYCDDGDLLYAWSASFGPRVWRGEKVIYHYHIWKVVEEPNINKEFLFIVLDYETEQLKTQSANGFALLHITKGTIENWKCKFPCLEEQRKIAGFLSAIDSKIQQVGAQIEKAETFKQGLLQQMFV